jgi:hypothetical protein
LEDRVRARNDRADAICRAFKPQSGEQSMTAYLISFALAGLVAVVVCESLS